MSEPVVAFKVTGIEELSRKLGASGKVLNRHLKIAMQRSVNEVRNNVIPFVPVGVSGNLRKSIGTEIIESPFRLVGKVGSSMKGEEYPAVMEFGRKPGQMPPPGALIRWVHIKLRPPEKDEAQVAFLVARAIGRHGIQGRHYLSKGFAKSKAKVQGYFVQAVRDAAKELN